MTNITYNRVNGDKLIFKNPAPTDRYNVDDFNTNTSNSVLALEDLKENLQTTNEKIEKARGTDYKIEVVGGYDGIEGKTSAKFNVFKFSPSGNGYVVNNATISAGDITDNYTYFAVNTASNTLIAASWGDITSNSSLLPLARCDVSDGNFTNYNVIYFDYYKGYAKYQDTQNLTAAKSYADTKADEALTAAKAYAGTTIGTEIGKLSNKIQQVESGLKVQRGNCTLTFKAITKQGTTVGTQSISCSYVYDPNTKHVNVSSSVFPLTKTLDCTSVPDGVSITGLPFVPTTKETLFNYGTPMYCLYVPSSSTVVLTGFNGTATFEQYIDFGYINFDYYA